MLLVIAIVDCWWNGDMFGYKLGSLADRDSQSAQVFQSAVVADLELDARHGSGPSCLPVETTDPGAENHEHQAALPTCPPLRNPYQLSVMMWLRPFVAFCPAFRRGWAKPRYGRCQIPPTVFVPEERFYAGDAHVLHGVFCGLGAPELASFPSWW